MINQYCTHEAGEILEASCPVKKYSYLLELETFISSS